MTIDLRSEMLDIRAYLVKLIDTQSRKSPQQPLLIHFGFYFDQNGWLSTYLDFRDHATMDGGWSTHLKSSPILPRPHWYEASELSDFTKLKIVGIDGVEVPEWLEQPNLAIFARILGDFIKNAVLTFLQQGIFQPLIGDNILNFCVEELTGLYTWPTNKSLLNEFSR